MKVFIDTNKLLEFFEYTKEGLEELKKLAVAITQNKIDLLLPDQVVYEFNRNREKAIANTLKAFEKVTVSSNLPVVCDGYPEREELLKYAKEYNKYKNKLIDQINADTVAKNLLADKVIDELFSKATRIPTAQFLPKAEARRLVGNPPGKKDSLGDAINWEALLHHCQAGEDLYFVTNDTDFVSPITNKMNGFLLDEWHDVKQSNVVFYSTLSEFFLDKYPEINFAIDLERDVAVKSLINSGNFNQTHNAIFQLSKFVDFTHNQVDEMFRAFSENNQIYWIKDDEDVKGFFETLAAKYQDSIDNDSLGLFYVAYQDTGSSEGRITEII